MCDYNWKWLFFDKIIESERATLQRMTMQHLTHFAENDPLIRWVQIRQWQLNKIF